jgi:PhzF family phenazine biosynthesis protein
MKISIINCFCNEAKNSGNPAAVVEHFEGSDMQRQKLASKLYASDEMPVTVFVEQGMNKHMIRCFYPSSEMNMCIHGTLAAAYLILEETKQEKCVFTTKVGNEIHIQQDKNCLQAALKEKHISNPSINNTILQLLLNFKDVLSLNPHLPCGVYSVGSPKLLIPLNSIEQLRNLNPNFESITQWSNETGVNGLYIYAPLNNSTHKFAARAFNPKAGCNEDAATGVAVGALACALKFPQISVSQGDSIGRPCQLTATYHNSENVLVGGIVQRR